MNIAENCSTSITLPNQLYQAIEQQAKLHGHSINHEIVNLLAASFDREVNQELADELRAWESASDEDWLQVEALLASEAY